MIVNLKKAAELIKNGETVAIPTETVYGLAADAFNIIAVKKIFTQKGRPPDNPLIVHICDSKQLQQLVADVTNDVQKLAHTFWPGPLSIVLKKRDRVPDIVTGGLNTVAVRMPNHPLALSLIEHTGPLTAPSANKSGRPSPTKPKHIVEDFGSELPILDGGTSNLGLESTVLDMSGKSPIILRPGFIDSDQISSLLGKKVKYMENNDNEAGKKSPGTRFTHYKPEAAVKWFHHANSIKSKSSDYIITHSEPKLQINQKNCFQYSGDFESLARDLYDHFRTADHLSCKTIWIESFDNTKSHPLLPALKNRIERAASA